MKKRIVKVWSKSVIAAGGFALFCFSMALALSMTLTPVLLGQSATTGALTGTVKDSSGAVVPNATVTVTSVATG